MKTNKHTAFPIISLLLSLFFICLTACKKWVTVDPPDSALATSSVFSSDATATAAMLGIYVAMVQSSGTNTFPCGSPSVIYGLSADELNYYGGYSTAYDEFVSNNLTISNSEVDAFWNQAYNYIYMANAILEGLNSSNAVAGPVKKQLNGEAKFIRAFCNFYLVNSFGDIPLVNSSDYRVNSISSRTPMPVVYQQILSDLQDADSLLSPDFSFSNGERLRPNKWTADALLSRVYLYLGQWKQAEDESGLLINQSNNFSLCASLDSVFLQNSSESIWQLMPDVPSNNNSIQDAYFFIPYPETSPFVALTPSLLAAFEPLDQRLVHWVDSTIYLGDTYYYPFKYKQKFSVNTSEYYTVFRLAEQYLIRAEARAELNELDYAINDLDLIRGRAGLSQLAPGLSQQQILDTIAHERRIEFFAEWGNRWLDLKRTHSSDNVLSVVKPGWKSTDTLYPIPQIEIQNDPHLQQNAGY